MPTFYGVILQINLQVVLTGVIFLSKGGLFVGNIVWKEGVKCVNMLLHKS